jgi:hypothetical protein
MPKIKRLLFYAIVVLIYLLYVGNYVQLVDAQDVGTYPLISSLLGAAPATLLSFFQLLLMGRLLNQDSDGDGILDGQEGGPFPFGNLPGLGRGRKNMMLFMGRHNIQVSNHDMKQ